MPIYQVKLPAGGHQVVNGCNAVIVVAGNEADAKNAASAQYNADAAPWDQATVTEVVEDATFAGLEIVITVGVVAANTTQFGGVPAVARYTVPNDPAFDTVDEIGAALATALNATALNGVTYTAGSDTLTIVAANNSGLAPITAQVFKVGDGGRFEVTSLALTVGAVGGSDAADRTIVITPLSGGVNPAFVAGFVA